MTKTKTHTTSVRNMEDTHMKAMVYHTYGSPDVLKLEEVQKPVPQDNEVLVQVHATSVNAGDWHLLRAKPFLMRFMGFGLLKPKHTILGSDIAGGVEVTAVCSTRNVDIVGLIGADHVIDYTQEDFTRNGQRYDLILAVNGYHSISAYKRALHPEGVYVMTGGSNAQLFQAMLLGPLVSMTGRQKMGNSAHKPNQRDLMFMKELLEASKVKPVIDRRFPLRDVADAIRYLEAGHAQGKVVITVEQNNHT